VTLEAIRAVLFEPVGCLAEFPCEEFSRAAGDLFASAPDGEVSGSTAYWHLLGLMARDYDAITPAQFALLEASEIAAVERADLYEDVGPALTQLQSLGTGIHLVSSLSRRALERFIARFRLGERLTGSIAREDAGGVMVAPLRLAAARTGLDPPRMIYLVDTEAAMDAARQAGLNAMLMINDYDEGRALAERSPAGGVVSLAELADALMLIEQRQGLRSAARMQNKPFELFEPG
jgi:beta-phosphoglucomutase-like phosphatase (HAD superfamily)